MNQVLVLIINIIILFPKQILVRNRPAGVTYAVAAATGALGTLFLLGLSNAWNPAGIALLIGAVVISIMAGKFEDSPIETVAKNGIFGPIPSIGKTSKINFSSQKGYLNLIKYHTKDNVRDGMHKRGFTDLEDLAEQYRQILNALASPNVTLKANKKSNQNSYATYTGDMSGETFISYRIDELLVQASFGSFLNSFNQLDFKLLYLPNGFGSTVQILNNEDHIKKQNIIKDENVHHFHPISFINQMRLICGSGWHEPVLNPQRTLYNSLNNYSPRSGAFGAVRNSGSKNHAGIDIFAPIGTPIYACLNGVVVSASYRGTKKLKNGYGNTIIIEVKKEDLDASRNNYQLEHTNPFGNGKGEKEKGPNFGDSNERYLLYAHLDTMTVSKGDKVTSGQQIGTGGNTGNALKVEHASNRHLHFEVLDKNDTSDYYEMNNRENAAFYVNFVKADKIKQRDNKD